jgi:hypothetical protein
MQLACLRLHLHLHLHRFCISKSKISS